MNNLLISAEHNLANLIRSSKLFFACSAEDLKILYDNFVALSVKKKSIVFEKGDIADGVYIILSGLYEVISISPEGKEIVFNVLKTGETFGEISLFDDLPRTATIRASSDGTLAFLSKQKFKIIASSLSKGFWISSTHILCELLRKKTDYIEGVHFLGAKQRIATKILELFQRHDLKPVLLSQEKLANMVGLTREITNKSLSSLQEKGIIKIAHSEITVLDPQKLYLAGSNICE